jgi:hypothetical protein
MTDRELDRMREILEEIVPMRGMGWKVAYALLCGLTAIIMSVATWNLTATIQAQADIVVLQTKVLALNAIETVPRTEYEKHLSFISENMRLNNMAHDRIVEKLDRLAERNWYADSTRGGAQASKSDLRANRDMQE